MTAARMHPTKSETMITTKPTMENASNNPKGRLIPMKQHKFVVTKRKLLFSDNLPPPKKKQQQHYQPQALH